MAHENKTYSKTLDERLTASFMPSFGTSKNFIKFDQIVEDIVASLVQDLGGIKKTEKTWRKKAKKLLEKEERLAGIGLGYRMGSVLRGFGTILAESMDVDYPWPGESQVL